VAGLFRRLFGSRPSREEQEAAAASYRARLASPQWEEVAAGLGRPIPTVLKELYADPSGLEGDVYVFDPAKPKDVGEAWYVNQFVPADYDALQPALESIPPGAFNFAFNEFGDPYYVELGAGDDGDGPVSVHYHDGGDIVRVAPSLREFLRWPRQPRSYAPLDG
jgi:hypothetical protein